MTDYIKIAGVSERDTDLLLLEEFTASPDFVQFFLERIGLTDKGYTFLEASRSVTDSTGESDLEVMLTDSDGQKFVLMLENKVNAGFQPKQAERYRARGMTYANHGKIGGFTTVLMAPARYFDGDKKGFDHRVDYEAARDWFAQSSLPPGRKHYKLSVLTSAIEKSTSGYQMVADAPVSNLWKDYWMLSWKIAPEFCMPEPSNKPASSSFIYFRDTGLPRGVLLVHKFAYGHFDLQFAGMGNRTLELREQYGSKLLPEMQIVKAAKSASIRVMVPPISVADTLEQQKDAVITAMEAGKKLLAWGKTNISAQE